MDQTRLADTQNLPHYQKTVLIPAMFKRHLIPSEDTLGPKITKSYVPSDSPQSSKKLLRKMSDYRWICYWNRQFKDLVGNISILFTSDISHRAYVTNW